MNRKLLAAVAAMVIFCILWPAASLAAKDTKTYPLKSKSTLPAPLGGKPLKFNKPEQKPIPLYPSAQKEKIGLSVGIKAGGSAGLTGARGDVTYSISNLVPGAAVRGSIGYLTGTNIANQDRLKMATVNLDGIIDIVKRENDPLNLYVGGGLIYPWKVSQVGAGGAWGAHAYLGGKYALQKDTSIYGEIAYSGIKYDPGESALRGVEAMVGYGYSF